MTVQTVLLADENRDRLDLDATAFDFYGFHVWRVKDGAEVLAHVSRRLPDLVCLSYRMSEIDGPAVCERLKQDVATRHVPVIISLTLRTARHQQRAEAAGADAVLARPYSPETLLSEARRVLAARRPSRHRYELPPVGEEDVAR